MEHSIDQVRVAAAKYFAMGAHMGVAQKRKYDGQDYIVHPIEVAGLLLQFATNPVSTAMVEAALLHDVIEDTKVSYEQVFSVFGKETFDLVEALTDVSRPEHGNRKLRKQMDLEHTRDGPIDAKSVKCADLISNLKSIVKYDTDFARVFVHEKERLLNDALTDADLGLLAECWRTLREAKETLANLKKE